MTPEMARVVMSVVRGADKATKVTWNLFDAVMSETRYRIHEVEALVEREMYRSEPDKWCPWRRS